MASHFLAPDFLIHRYKYESDVSPVSKCYMRAGIGNDRLVVCLSEYLPLRIVYRIFSMSTIGKCFVSRSMRVSELPSICTSRYGREKRKCWSQIALASMGGEELSPVVVEILSQK